MANAVSQRATPDYVQVQLTATGQALAGEHPLTVSNGRRSLTFIGAEPVKVELSYEWRAWLSKKFVNGETMFELVPAVKPAAQAATQPAATSEAAKAPAPASAPAEAAKPAPVVAQPASPQPSSKPAA